MSSTTAQILVYHLTALAMVATSPSSSSSINPPIENFDFPPQNSFCFFASGEFVFEERIKTITPSAELQGTGTLVNVHAHLPNTCVTKMKELWGAVYYISNDEKETFEEFAYQRMLLADVTVQMKDANAGQYVTRDCVSLDVGLMPHVLPLSIYTAFPRDLTIEEYLQRLINIGVPQDYVDWLSTLPKFDEYCPPPPYIAPPGFTAPVLPPDSSSPLPLGPGPVITKYPVPAGKVCIFVAGKLISEKALRKTLPSATSIGAAYLWDMYIALGGHTQPGHYTKYKGFDNIWGKVYTIDENEFEIFIRNGEKFLFISDVEAVFGLSQTSCKVHTIGLLPSGFPFNVYHESELDIPVYLKELRHAGAPGGYVNALESLFQLYSY